MAFGARPRDVEVTIAIDHVRGAKALVRLDFAAQLRRDSPDIACGHQIEFPGLASEQQITHGSTDQPDVPFTAQGVQ